MTKQVKEEYVKKVIVAISNKTSREELVIEMSKKFSFQEQMNIIFAAFDKMDNK